MNSAIEVDNLVEHGRANDRGRGTTVIALSLTLLSSAIARDMVAST